jgi:RNA polymerase sigma-70 factor (ECF subfamily)
MYMDLDLATRSAMLEAMPHLRSFAISLCRDRDQANDLAQEALLRACANIDKFKPGSNMEGWLFTILHNHYCSEYRKRRREVEDIDGAYAEALVVQPEQIVHLEYEDMRAALAELPNEMQQALALIAVEGVSYDQAARICNVSVGTIKSRVHRARARLAAMLSIDQPTDDYGDPASESIVIGAEDVWRHGQPPLPQPGPYAALRA